MKKSVYVTGIVKASKEKDSIEAKAIKEARKAQAHLNREIASIQAALVSKEDTLEIATEAVEAAKIAMPFSLENYDDAVFKIEIAKQDLEDAQDDLKARQALVAELFGA